MIFAYSQIPAHVLSTALLGVTWNDLFPYSLLIVWTTCLVVALLHPVSRAFLHCNLELLTKYYLHKMYVESDKKSGRCIPHITCIAIINNAGEFTKIFYGKPESRHLMNSKKD